MDNRRPVRRRRRGCRSMSRPTRSWVSAACSRWSGSRWCCSPPSTRTSSRVSPISRRPFSTRRAPAVYHGARARRRRQRPRRPLDARVRTARVAEGRGGCGYCRHPARGSLGLIAGYYKGAVDLIISTVFGVLLAGAGAHSRVGARVVPPWRSDNARWPAEVVLIVTLGIVSTPCSVVSPRVALTWSQRGFVMASQRRVRRTCASCGEACSRTCFPRCSRSRYRGRCGDRCRGWAQRARGRDHVRRQAVVGEHDRALRPIQSCDPPHLVFAPIICMFLTVLSLDFLGDVVRARFDVRESSV